MNYSTRLKGIIIISGWKSDLKCWEKLMMCLLSILSICLLPHGVMSWSKMFSQLSSFRDAIHQSVQQWRETHERSDGLKMKLRFYFNHSTSKDKQADRQTVSKRRVKSSSGYLTCQECWLVLAGLNGGDVGWTQLFKQYEKWLKCDAWWVRSWVIKAQHRQWLQSTTLSQPLIESGNSQRLIDWSVWRTETFCRLQEFLCAALILDISFQLKRE